MAGKAGAFLDKMDQAAASSLEGVGLSTPNRGSSSSTRSTQRLDEGQAGFSTASDNSSRSAAAVMASQPQRAGSVPPQIRGPAASMRETETLSFSSGGHQQRISRSRQPSSYNNMASQVQVLQGPPTPGEPGGEALGAGGGSSGGVRKHASYTSKGESHGASWSSSPPAPSDESLFEFLNSPGSASTARPSTSAVASGNTRGSGPLQQHHSTPTRHSKEHHGSHHRQQLIGASSPNARQHRDLQSAKGPPPPPPSLSPPFPPPLPASVHGVIGEGGKSEGDCVIGEGDEGKGDGVIAAAQPKEEEMKKGDVVVEMEMEEGEEGGGGGGRGGKGQGHSQREREDAGADGDRRSSSGVGEGGKGGDGREEEEGEGEGGVSKTAMEEEEEEVDGPHSHRNEGPETSGPPTPAAKAGQEQVSGASPSPDRQRQQEEELLAQQQQQQLQLQRQEVSRLSLENKLLKREVTSLNDELNELTQRSREDRNSLAHFETEAHSLREEVSSLDHMIRQLRSSEEDLQASRDAKDSQLQVCMYVCMYVGPHLVLRCICFQIHVPEL